MSGWIKHKAGEKRPAEVSELYAVKDGWGNVFYADGSVKITADFIRSEYSVSEQHNFERTCLIDQLWEDTDGHVENFTHYKLKEGK